MGRKIYTVVGEDYEVHAFTSTAKLWWYVGDLEFNKYEIRGDHYTCDLTERNLIWELNKGKTVRIYEKEGLWKYKVQVHQFMRGV